MIFSDDDDDDADDDDADDDDADDDDDDGNVSMAKPWKTIGALLALSSKPTSFHPSNVSMHAFTFVNKKQKFNNNNNNKLSFDFIINIYMYVQNKQTNERTKERK